MQVIGRLVGPLTNFPFIINSLIEGYISMERYEKYIFGSSSSRQLSDRSVSVDDMTSASTTPLMSRPTSAEMFSKGPFGIEENFILVQDAVFSWIPQEDSRDGDLPLEERLTSEYVALGESGTTLVMSPVSTGVPARHSLPARQAHLFGDPATFISRLPTTVEPLFHEIRTSFRLLVPSLRVKAGECVIIIGSPGSGKSSLLLALLGEMPQTSGCLKLLRCQQDYSFLETSKKILEENLSISSVGYASQVPWYSYYEEYTNMFIAINIFRLFRIPGGTVRSAILFGRPFIEGRYNRVISVCELQQVR